MTHPLFHVERSLMQARWVMPDVNLDDVEKLARQHDLPEIVARLLAAKNLAPDDVQSFLQPSLRNNFPDPSSMAGMDALAEYLASAVQEKRSIAIFGDFDVDGATSSAVLHRYLKAVGIDAPVYIPDRLTEGYGPNVEAFQKLKDSGAQVIILLDCGTAAIETVAAGLEMGLEIVILDHHEPGETIVGAHHIVNPKRIDDESGLEMLAACGVTFMACVALNAKLREQKFFEQNGIDEPPLKDWLDIVALGTVCDMVPLTGVNRLLVKQGFPMMERTSNPGLRALMDVSGLSGPVDTYHAGFVLGPRINAGSRVHRSDLGAQMLCTDDPEEARDIAWTLNDCNDKRKAMQVEMEREALEQVEARGLDQDPVIIVAAQNWHTGLSGLVAGRLKEKYKKPACVIAYVNDGTGAEQGRGSGRSIPGIHIAKAFMDAHEAGLLVAGGGHAMAGGFTLAPEKLEEFHTFMKDHIAGQAAASETNVETVIDGVLTVQGTRTEFVKMIQEHIGPFGQEHPEPLFVYSNARIHSADIVGESHIRLMMSDWEGTARIKAMAFRAVGTPLGEALLKNPNTPFHIAGHLKINSWQGRESAELHIRDAALVLDPGQQDLPQKAAG